MDNAFKPKETKLVNYNSLKYENQKMNNIFDSKLTTLNNMVNKPVNIVGINNNKPHMENTTTYSGDVHQMEQDVRCKVDSLNRMNNGFRNN